MAVEAPGRPEVSKAATAAARCRANSVRSHVRRRGVTPRRLIISAMRKKQLTTSDWRAEMRGHFSRAEFTAAGEIYDRAVEDGEAASYEDDLMRARILLKRDENKAVAFLVRRPPRSNALKHRGEWEMLLGVGYARMRDFERADHHFGLARRLLKAPGIAHNWRTISPGARCSKADSKMPGRLPAKWLATNPNGPRSPVKCCVHSSIATKNAIANQRKV